MSDTPVSPQKVMQLITGHWAAAAVGAATEHSIFTHIEKGHDTPETIAAQAKIPVRGVKALLDGLVAVGLVQVSKGRYANTKEASTFLVDGKPGSLSAMAQLFHHEFTDWAKLAEVAKEGGPKDDHMEVVENPYWEKLVPAIMPLSLPVAQLAVEKLNFAKAGKAEVLDVGGGSGVFVLSFLRANPEARGAQADWVNVNRIAKNYAQQWGVADRFRTLDGDFHKTELGEGVYDVIVYSHIAHGQSPQENIETFRRLHRALKDTGTLLVNDFVVNEDRSGPPFALLFHLTMFLVTQSGSTYREADYRSWLSEAGFQKISFEPTPSPATLVFAKKK